MNVCQWCDHNYTPTRAHQRFCSLKCNALHREYIKRVATPAPPKPVGWRARPTANEARGGAHQRLRAMLLPSAYGQPCPMCGHLMTNQQALALDHIIPIAKGGPTTLGNVRIVHAHCNHRAGSALGNSTRARRDRSQHSQRAV